MSRVALSLHATQPQMELPPSLEARLSREERRVLSLSAAGLADKEVAVRLGITLNTVRTYWRRMRQKVGDVTRAQLIAQFVGHSARVEIDHLSKEADILLEEIRRRRHAEERFRAVAESAAIGIIVLDLDGRCVFSNQAWHRISGLSHRLSMGFRWQKVFPQPDLQRILPDRPDLPAVRALSSHLNRRDRAPMVVEVRTAPVQMEGHLAGYVATIEDVTEQTLARGRLEKSEAWNRAILELIPGMVWVSEGYLNFIYTNQNFQIYFGRSTEQFNQEGWEVLVHPDDLDRTRRLGEEAVRNSTRYENRLRLRSADGSYSWFLSVAMPFDSGGVLHWIGINISCEDPQTPL